jgi:hypothetical protein
MVHLPSKSRRIYQDNKEQNAKRKKPGKETHKEQNAKLHLIETSTNEQKATQKPMTPS